MRRSWQLIISLFCFCYNFFFVAYPSKSAPCPHWRNNWKRLSSWRLTTTDITYQQRAYLLSQTVESKGEYYRAACDTTTIRYDRLLYLSMGILHTYMTPDVFSSIYPRLAYFRAEKQIKDETEDKRSKLLTFPICVYVFIYLFVCLFVCVSFCLPPHVFTSNLSARVVRYSFCNSVYTHGICQSVYTSLLLHICTFRCRCRWVVQVMDICMCMTVYVFMCTWPVLLWCVCKCVFVWLVGVFDCRCLYWTACDKIRNSETAPNKT